MLHRLISRLTFANVIAMIALFVALSGVAYAAALAENSVTRKTIQNSAVNGPKVANKSLSAADITGAAIDQLTYVKSTVALPGNGTFNAKEETVACPAGTNLVGGGATTSDTDDAVINELGPSNAGPRTIWTATGESGQPGQTMTVTAICAPARSTAP